MTRRRTRFAALLAGVLLATALTGCDDDTAEDPAPATSQVPVVAPPVRACYLLDVAAGLELSSTAPRVACTRRHTSVTVAVGRVGRNGQGKALPIESAAVQRQISRACKAAVDEHVGGSTETRRLSRVQAVWFSPDAAQLAAGARWYRCDLVVAGSPTSFTPLPRRTRGLLDGRAARRYETCGTAAPGTRGFRRVSCSVDHTWRARASIDLPAGAKYLGKAAGKAADSACRDVEARRSVTATRFRWSFEWPTRAQWAAGQRYGLCWTPDS